MLIPFALALSAQVSAAPANAETWEWDSKTPICSLKQQAPLGAQAVTIERTPGGEETELLITLQAGSKLGRGRFLDAAIATDSGRIFPADVSFGVDKDGRSNFYLVSPDPAFIEALSGTSSFQVSYAKNKSIRVLVNIPAKLIATLRECEDTSMREWGIDPVAWRSLKSGPLPVEHIRARFSQLDYPADALAANVEADAVTRLDIATDGTVAKCGTVNAGLPKAFEAASCKVLKGAKFRPATDADGKPTPAPILYDVRFRTGD
jgi:hypothetical protein